MRSLILTEKFIMALSKEDKDFLKTRAWELKISQAEYVRKLLRFEMNNE